MQDREDNKRRARQACTQRPGSTNVAVSGKSVLHNRVDAVCDDIRRVASGPLEPPGAGAVLPGRVAALPCAGYAPWACRVRFAVSTVCSPCAGRKHRGRQPRGLGFRLAGAVPSPTGGLQLAFTAHVDARPLTTSGRRDALATSAKHTMVQGVVVPLLHSRRRIGANHSMKGSPASD